MTSFHSNPRTIQAARPTVVLCSLMNQAGLERLFGFIGLIELDGSEKPTDPTSRFT